MKITHLVLAACLPIVGYIETLKVDTSVDECGLWEAKLTRYMVLENQALKIFRKSPQAYVTFVEKYKADLLPKDYKAQATRDPEGEK